MYESNLFPGKNNPHVREPFLNVVKKSSRGIGRHSNFEYTERDPHVFSEACYLALCMCQDSSTSRVSIRSQRAVEQAQFLKPGPHRSRVLEVLGDVKK